MKTSISFLLIIVSLLIISCSPAEQMKYIPKDIEDQPQELDRAIDIGIQTVVRQTKDLNKQMTVAILEPSFLSENEAPPKDLLVYIQEDATTKIALQPKFKIVERSQLNQVLSELKLNQTDLFINSIARKEFGKLIGADAILTISLQDLPYDIKMNMRLVETETGVGFAAGSVRILKDELATKLMGKKLPGELTIVTDGVSSLYLDGEYYSTVDRQLTLSLPPSSYSIRLERDGFKPYKGSISIREKEQKNLQIEYVTHYGVPFKSFVAGAILPGLELGWYGSSNGSGWQVLDGFALAGFYVAGGMYLYNDAKKRPEPPSGSFNQSDVDQFNSDELTFQNEQNTKLLIFAGSYFIHLLASVGVGYDFMDNNKYGREINSSGYSDRNRLSYQYPTTANPYHRVGYSIRF